VETLFHVRFVVEVGHLPSVLFVVVIVRVSRMVARRYAFGVGCGSAVVEVHLGAVLIRRRGQQFLWFFPAVRSTERKVETDVGSNRIDRLPRTDHPNQQDDDDYDDNS
jgi:hypothetical protein